MVLKVPFMIDGLGWPQFYDHPERAETLAHYLMLSMLHLRIISLFLYPVHWSKWQLHVDSRTILCRNLHPLLFTRPDLHIPLLWTETLGNSVLVSDWHWMNQKLPTASIQSFQKENICLLRPLRMSLLHIIVTFCSSSVISTSQYYSICSWVLIFPGKIQFQQALEIDFSFPCGDAAQDPEVYSNPMNYLYSSC